jgi:hypothetical protein
MSRAEFRAAYRPKPFKGPPVDYGVVVWHQDPRYQREEVKQFYKTHKVAQRAADKLNAQGGEYVVRTFDRPRQNRPGARKRSRARANPPVVIFGNPPRQLRVQRILSRDVQELWYKHSNGNQYYHPFDKGVTLQLLSDGSVRFVRPDGLPLWDMFPADTR